MDRIVTGFKGALTFLVLLSAGQMVLGTTPELKEDKPELVVSPSLPVEQTETEIRLYQKPNETLAGQVTILGPQGDVVLQKDVSTEDRHLLHWTPQETGYHEIKLITDDDREMKLSQLPVVWQRLYFPHWPQFDVSAGKHFPLLTSTVLSKPNDIDEWQRRGSVAVGPVYYRRGENLKMDLPEEQTVNRLVERWARPLEKGADGVWIDELCGYPTPQSLKAVNLEMKALKKLREKYPDKLISSAVGGAILREYAAGHKTAGALVTSEMYGEFHNMVHGSRNIKRRIDQRIETMRNTDLIFERGYQKQATTPDQWKQHGGIILLSTNHVGGGIWEEPAVARMENYVRYIKKTAPEMPGIGFWSSGSTRNYMEKVGFFKAAERMAEKYYVRPVVDVRNIFFSNYEPTVEEPVKIHVGIHNVGGMDARNLQLNLYAVGPESRHHEIGTIEINRLGTGFDVIEHNGEHIKFIEKHGNTYGLLPGKSHVTFPSRQTKTCEWTPPLSGYYKIIAEVKPAEEVTILTGRYQKEILVK